MAGLPGSPLSLLSPVSPPQRSCGHEFARALGYQIVAKNRLIRGLKPLADSPESTRTDPLFSGASTGGETAGAPGIYRSAGYFLISTHPRVQAGRR